MAFEISSNLGRRLIANPVMALKVIMGAELDVFQAARFKHWWFCPWVMDHSGVSTGKSEMAFLFIMLRLILLPLAAPRKPRIATVYYQSQGTAEEVFLPKIEEYMLKSRIFENQIRRQHAGKFWKEKKNVIVVEMREGGWCEIPAGDFMKDSQNQASKRFNDLLIDEGAMIDTLGKGVNKQLLQRNTRECFNPNHPVHANHTLFLGHAESPHHVYHERYANARKKWRKQGSQNHATITSSYKDFKGVFHQRYGQDVAKKAAEQYLTDLDAAEHAQIYDGLWKLGGKGIYSETLRENILSAICNIHLRRMSQDTIYVLGWDTAPSLNPGADLSSPVVWAADPVHVIPEESAPGYYRVGNQMFFVRAVYGDTLLPGANVDEKSGIVHKLHRAFGFSAIVMDPLGGSAEVYQKMRESRQFIDGRWEENCTGLCTPAEAFEWPMAQPLVYFYKRGEPLFASSFGEKYVADNSGPIDFAHRHVSSMFRRGEVAWPMSVSKMSVQQHGMLSPDEAEVLVEMEKILLQFGNIAIRTKKDGTPELSEKGFQMFKNSGKKDGAMASIYGLLGLRVLLLRMAAGKAVQQDKSVIGVFS